MTSCNEMDTAPNAGYVTEDQKIDAIEHSPELLSAGVNTLPSMFKKMHQTYDRFDDFGIASTNLMFDCMTEDMMSYNVGFNWYAGEMLFNAQGEGSVCTYILWNTMYKLIFSANNVIKTLPEEIEDETNRYYAAQALAFRAYAYFSLAQRYQFTYKGHESAPCVPLYTEKNTEEVSMNGGGPRATVQEVYDLILDDLDRAIELLDGTSYTAATTAETKTFVNLNVAYGLRARVNLVMNNWSAAASDADKAIQLNNAAGLTPYTIAELLNKQSDGTVLPAGFTDGNDHSWMWDINYTKDDLQYQWTNCNFVAFVSSFSYSGGYTTLGAWRYIGAKLYSSIPSTDVRKFWWVNPNEVHNGVWWTDFTNGNSWVTMPNDYVSWIRKSCTMSKGIRYLVTKFNRRDGIDPAEPDMARTGDYMMMRAEEMYYIKAEAEAMSGNPAQGAQTLRDFVTQYRNPSYAFAGGSAEAVQEECWNQRRIEFWGEGLALNDLMRLNKGVDRIGQGFQPEACLQIAAGDNLFLYRLPRSEVDNNPAITENNPYCNAPNPVPDPTTYSWDW